MEFLKLLGRPAATGLLKVPQGSFTVDGQGVVIASTLPQSFPETLVREIGLEMLQAFRSARAAKLPLGEVVVEYAALKLTGRELKGGAIVFIHPSVPERKTI